jgi:outer membrane protein OmpA-like peptidoglycan-associated protein
MKAAAFLLVIAGSVVAQVPNPTTQQPMPPNSQSMPIFKVTVVSRTAKAVNYHHRTGTTHIAFRGTELMPQARGEASVQSQMGSTKVDTGLDHLTPASQFGPEYMTYVMWAITPEGRAMNLGEVVLEGNHAKLLSTTDLQTFGLIVTAEPYFAVTQPSDVVVAENFITNDTSGTIEAVDAKYELLERGEYIVDRGRYAPIKVNPKGPLQLAEAENAVEIARLTGADRYASETFQKAVIDLQNAEGFLNGSKDRKESETNSREAAQMAEDARIITIRKIRAEEAANAKAASDAREAAAQAAAAQSALQAQQAQAQAQLDQQRREQADQARAQADQARAQAEQMKSEAMAAAQQAAAEKAAADAARQQALAAQSAASAEADRLRQMNQQSEQEKTQLRERLKQQFNSILETRETARGLIVNISDVLFDFNQYTLKPGAREKLAKVSGILLAYPGLKIQLEGHTDSIGTDDYNMKLSQQRADAVMQYLVTQGVPDAGLTSVGLGKAGPVASNDTDAGRQQNRRVEMVVSGDPIGVVGNLPQ